jgi:ubiquinone/menaquinone biosynthesis C-methylase UbiE
LDELGEIKAHWRSWAVTYGTTLRATTKASTSKALEIDGLARRFRSLLGSSPSGTVLEVGCGNGFNCLELAAIFPRLKFDGVDYVEEMIEAANKSRRESRHADRVRFVVGNALRLASHNGLASSYDIVFTDRCLINLPTPQLQKDAITALATKVRPDGHLVMIENSQVTYETQNRYRELLGLPSRTPAGFNVFIDEAEILPHLATTGLELLDAEDFISLHDLVLYVLLPCLNGGEIDYDHPLVEVATELNRAVSAITPNAFGASGQNRLYCCRKIASALGPDESRPRLEGSV